ncbi:MAG: hypothetical protein AAGM22_18655 [Acidobacteriota bacterium]
MEVRKISFSGKMLERGFWLYAWRITCGPALCVYVGRTGDSSSPNAASPFARMGQHLDFRDNAKGNAMMRNLRGKGVDPVDCEFEQTAVGPIFPEQAAMEEHQPYRDLNAAMEMALANELKGRGYDVLGQHASRKKLDETLFKQVMALFEDSFPPLK